MIEIPETPVSMGDEVFTARRDAEDVNRYQVFGQQGMGPAGYLELHYCDKSCPTDYRGRGPRNESQIRVLNHRGERLNCVSNYRHALAELIACADAHNYATDTRLTENERPHVMAGWCAWQTEYGTGAGIKLCDQPRDPRDLYHCTEHREQVRQETGKIFNR